MQSALQFFAICLLTQSVSATTTFVTTTLTEPFDRSGWEAGLTAVTTDTFSSDIPQANILNLDSGIISTASSAIGSANHLVDSNLGVTGRFNTTLRHTSSTSPGYSSVVFTFPTAVTAFGADFHSIGGSSLVSVTGTFDGVSESYDLRALFTAANGGSARDRGFFGIKTDTPFTSITLIASGNATNDAFHIDNAAFAVPEPSVALLAAFGGLFAGLRRRR